jgi:hypothetical protein
MTIMPTLLPLLLLLLLPLLRLQIQFYNFNRPSFAENTGHFSAMVWKDSVTIGCAANLRCRFKTWICQFTPPGERGSAIINHLKAVQ